MADSGHRKAPGTQRSLLELGKTRDARSRPAGGAPTLLSASAGRSQDIADDLLARHRLARSRREARRNALLERLAAQNPAASGETEDTGSTREPPPHAVSRLWSERFRGENRYRDADWQPLIDPLDVIGGIWNSKSLIVAMTVIGLVLGALHALSTPKLYHSTAEILIDPRELKLSPTDIKQSDLPYNATLALIENQVHIIASDTVVRGVVERLNLARDPEFNGSLGGGLGEMLTIARALLGGGSASDAADATEIAVENLYESFTVERQGKTFVVAITVSSQEAQKAALIANTFTDVYLDIHGSLQSGTVSRANNEVSAKLEELKQAVGEAENKVERYKAQNDIVDAGGKLITDEELLRLNDSLAAAKAKTIELSAKAANIRDVDVSGVIEGGLPEQVSAQALAALRSQYAEAKQQLDQLAVNLGARHPQLREARARMESAQQGIRAELKRIVSATQVDLQRAVRQEQDLAARLARLKARQANLSEDLVELRELERDAASKRLVYENYLLRAREFGQQAGLDTNNFSIISKAQPARKPTGPRRAVVAVFGGFAGFLLGVMLGAMRGIWNGYRVTNGTRAGTVAPGAATGQQGQAQSRHLPTGPAEEYPAAAQAPVQESPLAQPVQPQVPLPQHPPVSPMPYPPHGAVPASPHYYAWMQPPTPLQAYAPFFTTAYQPGFAPAAPAGPPPAQESRDPAPRPAQPQAPGGEDMSEPESRQDDSPRSGEYNGGRPQPVADIADIRRRLRNFRDKVDSLSTTRRR